MVATRTVDVVRDIIRHGGVRCETSRGVVGKHTSTSTVSVEINAFSVRASFVLVLCKEHHEFRRGANLRKGPRRSYDTRAPGARDLRSDT